MGDNFMVVEFCLFNTTLESMSLPNDIWYKRTETGIDSVMKNNAICVHFHAK